MASTPCSVGRAAPARIAAKCARCSGVTIEECKEVHYKEQFHNITKDVCNKVPKQHCVDVPEEKCVDMSREHCKDVVNKLNCFTMYNNKFETQQGRTEYDTLCDIISAKTCSVVYDKMCSMESDRECKMEYDSIYESVKNQECSTEYDIVCEDAQEEQCSVVNQRKCKKSHYYEELCDHTTVKSDDATKEN